MENKNLSNSLKELHRLFNHLNKEIFKGELPEVILTIQSKGKTNTLGWFTVGKVWEHGEIRKHEINISAECFKRGYLSIGGTLLHEMIHLYCSEKEIKDTSRGYSYHNKSFKKVSEEHGFYYKEDAYSKKIGWSNSSLTNETIELLNKFNIDGDIFAINRMDTFNCDEEEEKKKKSNIIKWVCGCGQIIRTSKEGLRVLCLDCETMFMMEDEMQESE